MKKTDLSTSLKQLTTCLAVSGYEWDLGIAQVIEFLIGRPGQRIGNNLVYRLGRGKQKILISAHMDEVGFFISQIEKDFVRIVPIGDILVTEVIGQKLVFSINGQRVETSPITPAKSFSNLKIRGITGAKVGTVGSFTKSFSIKNDEVEAPSLDNKVGCLILIELLKELGSKVLRNEFIFCFTDREEVGFTGVMSAIKMCNPDLYIDIDAAYALPLSLKNRKNWCIPSLGKGPALQLMGTNFIISSDERQMIEQIAKNNTIPYQYEIPDGSNGGTNTSLVINAGYRSVQVNVPVVNQHSAKSRASLADIRGTVRLLLSLVSQL
jgi:tetrahedral aminopeptidase